MCEDTDEDTEKSDDVSRWHDILSQDSEETVHWYQQFCLNWEVVHRDMYRLSTEQPFGRPLLALSTFKPNIRYCLMHCTLYLGCYHQTQDCVSKYMVC